MARKFLTPTTTCSLTSTSSACAKTAYVWLGLAAPVDGAACAAFYAGSTTGDEHIWTLLASPNQVVGPVGPFQVSTCFVHADITGTRASALISSASY